MANAFVDWLKKKAQQDVINPVENAVKAVAAPVEHAAAPVVQQAAQTVNNDVIKPVVRDVLKPVATAAAPEVTHVGYLPAVIPHVAAPIFKTANNIDSAVTTGAEDAAKGIGEGLIVKPAAGTYDAAKLGVGKLTGNKTAAVNATIALKNDYLPAAHMGQQLLRTVPQAVETVGEAPAVLHLPHTTGTYEPDNPVTKALFGSTPVQSIEAGVHSNYLEHPKLPLPERVALSTAYGAGQLAQDVPVVGKAAELASEGIKAADVAGKVSKAADAVKTANTALGEAGHVRIPTADDAGVNPEALNSVTNLAKERASQISSFDKQAKGGQLLQQPDGSYTRVTEHSPAYSQIYKQTGKPPTQADYLQIAHDQLAHGTDPESVQYQAATKNLGIKTPKAAPIDYDNVFDEAGKAPVESKPAKVPPTEALATAAKPEQVPIEKLTSYESAPDQAKVDAIKSDIAAGKPVEPLLVKKDSLGNFGVEDGKHRLEALKQSGATTAPVVGDIPPEGEIGANVPKSELEEYMKTFNVPELQAKIDLQNIADNKNAFEAMPKEQQMRIPKQLSVSERRELIDSDPNQATTNKVELSPLQDTEDTKYSVKDRARSAIAQSEGINQEAEHRLTRAVDLGNKLNIKDKSLLYKYDNGDSIESLAKEATNPKQFTKAANAYADATDYDLAARRAGGEATLRQHNYVPHNYAVDEAWMDDHDIPQDQRIQIGKEVKGFRDISAKYPSYLKASQETNGALKPLNADPVADLADYQKGGFSSRRNNLLRLALAKSTPEDVGALNTVRVGDKQLTQGAGHLPFSASDDLQKQLKGFEKTTPPSNVVTKVADKAGKVINSATKRLLFFGTPFHYINEQASFIGKNLLNPVNLAKGEARFITSVATKGGYQRLLDDAATKTLPDGSNLLESIRKMGVVLPDDSRLTRASSAFSLTEAESKLLGGLDPNSKEAVDLGQQINHLMGHRNLSVESESPRVHNLLSVGTLAPSWSTTQLGLVKDALTKGGAAGRYARGAVVGKRALEAGIGIGGSTLNTHHLQTFSQMLNEAGLTPQNPVPNIELNSKTKSGENQEMVEPTDAAGLAAGLVSDPSHFVQSRMSPALSLLTKIATNQNWNGEPLAEGPHDANYYKQLVSNAALNSVLPIGVQNLTNPTHSPNNPSIVQGIEQDFGGRLKTNPNDPKYIATQQYYKALDNAMNSLTPNSPAMGAFLETFGVTKDPITGNYLMTPNSEMTVAKAASLNAFPAAAAAANKMAQTLKKQGQSVDPYYLLNPTQQKAYNAYETMPPLSADRTDWQNRNPWYSKFADAQTKFFNSLPAADPNKPKNPIQYPTFDKQTTADMNAYYALPTGTGKNDFLDEHPDIGQALNKQFAYSNATRVARGYQPLKGYPQPSPQLQKQLDVYDTLDKADAKSYAAANPGIYNFFDQASEYSLNKDAGLNSIQGNNITPAEVKTINSLGEDIYYDGGLPGDNGQLVAPTGGSGSGASSGGYGSKGANPLANALYYLTSEKAPKTVTLKVPTGAKMTTAKAPKLLTASIKRSTISKGKKATV